MITLHKTYTSLVITGLLLSVTNSTRTELKCVPHLGKWSAMAFLVASVVALYHRSPEKDFTPRYNLKAITEVNKALSKKYFKNLWYLYYDGFVGQKAGDRYLVMTSEEKLAVESHPEIPASGVLGTLNEFIKPIKDAAHGLGLGYLVYKTATAHPSEHALFGLMDKKSHSKDALHTH